MPTKQGITGMLACEQAGAQNQTMAEAKVYSFYYFAFWKAKKVLSHTFWFDDAITRGDIWGLGSLVYIYGYHCTTQI